MPNGEFEMGQVGLFDLEKRYAGLDAHGDPLVVINGNRPLFTAAYGP